MSIMYPFTMYNMKNQLGLYNKNLTVPNGFWNNNKQLNSQPNSNTNLNSHSTSNSHPSQTSKPNLNSVSNLNTHSTANPNSQLNFELNAQSSNNSSTIACLSNEESSNSKFSTPNQTNNQLNDLSTDALLLSAQKLFKCETCGRLFAQKINLQNHERTHTGQKPFVCLVCLKAFSQKTNLKNHERIHSGERPYICIVCAKSFSQRTNLRNHERIHSGERPYKCIMCPKAFSQLTNLRNHERTHTGVKPYTCTVCLKSFAQQAELTCHERVHTGIKPYTCSFCLKSFSQLTNLRNHERIHTKEKPFKCPICVKAFCQRTDLRNHLRVHTKEKPFACNICPKAFAQRTDLKNHLRVHSGEKPYVCLICGKTFSQVTNLRNHERTHSGEKPFVCSVCDKAFSQRSTLKNHERTHEIGGLNTHKYQGQNKCLNIDCQDCEVNQNIDSSNPSLDSNHEQLCFSKEEMHLGQNNSSRRSEDLSGESSDKNSLTCDICQREFSQRVQLDNHVCIETADEGSSLFQPQPFPKEGHQASMPKSHSSSIISRWIAQHQKQDHSKDFSKESPSLTTSGSSPLSSSLPAFTNSINRIIQNTHLAPGSENPWFFVGGDSGTLPSGGTGDLQLQSALLSSGYLHSMPQGWSNHYGWPRGFPVTPRWNAISKDLIAAGVGLDNKAAKQRDAKTNSKVSSKNMNVKQKADNICENLTNS